MRTLLAAGAVAAALLGSGCSGNAGGSQADILSGTFSGTSGTGQQVVFTVSGDTINVDGVKATLDDPTSNAAFSVELNGETDDYSCSTTNDGKTIHCSVRRTHVATAQVPCANLQATPSPTASMRPAASPSPKAPAASPSGTPGTTPAPTVAPPGPQMCSVHPLSDESIDLLRICTSANC